MTSKKIFFTIIVLLTAIQTIISQSIEDQIEKAFDDTSMTMRGKITQEHGVYSLFFFDAFEKDSHVKFLQDKGYHGGGPSWLAMTYAAFNIFEPNIIDSLEYELGVSGITFKGNSKEDLETVARVISLIKEKQEIMLDMIERAKKLQIMK